MKPKSVVTAVMTNREKLRENYEDALFALAMDEYAVREGERLLLENEALREDPAAALPEDVNRRCRQAMRRAMNRRGHKLSVRGLGRAAGRLALTAVLLAALFTTAFAASSGFRNGTISVLMAFSDKAASWKITNSQNHTLGSDTDLAVDELNIYIEELPDGYEISNVEKDRIRAITTYQNSNGDELILSVFLDENTTFNYDIEDYDYYEKTMVQGYDAVVMQKNDCVRIGWVNSDLGVVICLDSINSSVGVNEITMLAESVTIR